MVAPAIAAAGIAAGASIAGGIMGSRAQASASSQSRQFQADFAKWQLSHDRKKYRYAVEDAKAAGLHPLFALGTSPGFTPTATAGAPPSGNYMGEGVARAGEAISKGITGAATAKQVAEAHAITMARQAKGLERDHIELLKAESDLARLTQGANAGPRMTPDGAIVHPLGEGFHAPGAAMRQLQGSAVHTRPRLEKPNLSIPLRAELIADDGWRYRVLSPEAGMDEIGQADLVYQWLMRKTRQARLALPREIKIWMGRWKAKRGTQLKWEK